MSPTDRLSGTPPRETPPLSWGCTAWEKSREVRLGLVLYGGVSLAIYINGVCHEFFRTVRGRGVYRFIKALTDSDVVVDVISGTSAGGINGIFLAFALCNEGTEFQESARLWSEHGDISKLLRTPNDKGPEARLSLLDSEGYYKPKLIEAFRKMYNSGSAQALRSTEDPSALQELDLFITGTDVDGRISTQFDDAGHPIDVKDHRTVFCLKHREGREDKQPFKPQQQSLPVNDDDLTVKALAKLACITSCFPAAFSPVMVALQDGGPGSKIPPEDALLRRWGQLAQTPGTDYRCFLDGGVLDNKPFSYTIKSIFSRHTVREVDRKLCYVEPDPELFEQKQRTEAPDAVKAVLAAVVGIPRYESIGDDLQLISEHNNRVLQHCRITQSLEGLPSEHGSWLERLRGKPVDRPVSLEQLSPAQRTLYHRSRLVSISERIVKGLLREKGQDRVMPPPGVAPPQEQDQRKLAAELSRHFEEAQVDTPLLFEKLDVTFRLRRLYHTVYTLYDHLYLDKTAAPQEPGRLHALLRTLNRQIELHEVLQAAMERLIDEVPIDWLGSMKTAEAGNPRTGCQPLWSRVLRVFKCLLDESASPAAVLPPTYVSESERAGESWLCASGHGGDPLQRFREELSWLSERIVHAEKSGQLDTWPLSNWQSLLDRFGEYEQDILDDFVPEPTDLVRQAYQNFDGLDAMLFPLQAVSGVHEKDIIETVRISPRDAAKGFSAIGLEHKVAGDAVYHFGGFFKRSWRSNDILWGRLDGLCQLVEILLDRDRLTRIASNPSLRERVRERLFPSPPGSAAPEDPALPFTTLFPHSGQETRDRLGKWLDDLLCKGDTESARIRRDLALTKPEFEAFQARLIEAAQLEILVEEVPNVITDALTEQAEWNHFQMTRPIAEEDLEQGVPPPWAFLRGKKRLDPLVQVTGAAMLASQRFERLCTQEQGASCPGDTSLGQYFKMQYRVGKEQLQRDVPKVVLLELLATALLVLNNCLLAILGDRARSIKRSPLYLLGVYLPLHSVHGFLSLMRRNRPFVPVVLACIITMSLVAGLTGVVWWHEIISPGNELQRTWLLLFIIIPLLLLLLSGSLLVMLSRRKRRSIRRASVQRVRGSARFRGFFWGGAAQEA